jgi:hypothetical protein
VSSFRSPLRYQRNSPADSVLTPSLLAWIIQAISIGPAMNLPRRGETRRPRRVRPSDRSDGTGSS